MRFFITIILVFFFSKLSFGQSVQLAQNYFEQGEYEKSKTVYQQLFKKTSGSYSYLMGVVTSLQQLQEYEEAEKYLLDFSAKTKVYPNLFVEIGNNYQLQNEQEKAKEYYQLAIKEVERVPNYIYSVGNAFQKYNLLDEAELAYKKALEKQQSPNIIVQLASVYGSQGKLEEMFSTYLDLIKEKPEYFYAVNRNFSAFIKEDAQNEANQILRKLLLKKIQQNPDLFYNQMLSWLFTQQKDYKKAFIQEKAIYQRSPQQNLRKIIELASIANENGNIDTAKEILNYTIEEATSEQQKLNAYELLFEIEIAQIASEKEKQDLYQRFQEVFANYGLQKNSLALQLQYAKFLAFNLEDNEEAKNTLYKALELPLNKFEEARTKMVLADVLVYEEKFNQALIYYSQVQNLVQNNQLAQESTFKVAKTSYYKGDFKWAQTQLKVLKKATSQLIANDALQLNLLISDNSLEDSTQTALKLFAKADLYTFQHKNKKALVVLDSILHNHKGEKIEDEALFRKAKLFEKEKQFQLAKESYQQIIQFYGQDILADDAYFYLAELYNNQLNLPEKAKENYEQIIFNFSDSIFFVEARKKYRILRGDQIE
ncbi:Tetratricopeptide repeat-containing protein [Mesonia phycicola]|uniref:Tetratricopeptide repeat-containing protein n=1 Tax=Mesonia phycicola TaxID=579105 RepID=A0A1M6EI79_9FLAO|nr:tetratricopeptide repeat protein [Mesonia phycicola]SHI85141.1 Tetratricopeptide repeat-containing protein [Mesonia phycicola]